MLVAKQVINHSDWEKFVKSQPYTLFVQSVHYGEFYQKINEKFWIIGVYDEDKLVGGGLVVSTHAKRGSFLYVPYGPLFANEIREEAMSVWVNFLKKFGRDQKYNFIRVSPFFSIKKENNDLFKRNGFRAAPMHVLAETTWLLNIEKNEEELLAEMNKNHRNLIRRCQKEGVKIEQTNNQKDIEKFNILLDETTKRHKFHRFSRKYVEAEFGSFAPHNEAIILNAYLNDGTLDASAVIMFYGTMACYRHGASIGRDKHAPTSYLLQWEAIREAKKRGCTLYNFWGIAPENSTKAHPFFGITHFKKGFGGKQRDLIHCQDIPLSVMYWKNWIIESIRRIKRGF
ncbi:MAG: peptidoglycan bridge formation glycyltransferase FemA/FemB family protein [Candidatus Magasanikbacteria bacterium]|nr:peptidoglycan bridge formation glycyltransferase FemA/FemB family protein [Candidatus Magasanikbacteria bacterium]